MTRATFRRALRALVISASLLAVSAGQVLAGGGFGPFPK